MSEISDKCISMYNSGMTPKQIYDIYYSTVSNSEYLSFARTLRGWRRELPSVTHTHKYENKSFDLIETLKKGIQLSELSERLNISLNACNAVIDDIKSQGYNVQTIGAVIKISNIIVPSDNHVSNSWNGEKVIRFGLMGDTQINSKYTQITHLHKFYDICKSEGIETVYHTGDIDEGEKMRPGMNMNYTPMEQTTT